MKKIILTFCVFLAAGFFLNFNSNAGCETSLPNQLQACFNAVQLNAIQVTVIGSSAFITGNVPVTLQEQARACIDEYTAASATCPGAPTLVYSSPPPGYNTATQPRANNQTTKGG